MRAVILTMPALEGGSSLAFVAGRLRSLAKAILRSLNGFLPVKTGSIGGPEQVARSLLRGLRALNVRVARDPWCLSGRYDIIFVPNGLAAFKQALRLKANGLARVVVGGPNLCMTPAELELDHAPAAPDVYIQPCEWALREWIRLDPGFPCPVVIGTCGVDPVWWRPICGLEERARVLIYDKVGDKGLLDMCKIASEACGCAYSVLHYGRFKPRDYRRLLGRAFALVYLSKIESQGIALFEAWAMDVPTLVLGTLPKDGCPMSAPYLTSETGAFFNERKELQDHLNALIKKTAKFSPRGWIEKNGTDTVTSQAILDKVSASCMGKKGCSTGTASSGRN